MHLIDPALAPEAERVLATLAAGRRRAIYRRIAVTAGGVIAIGAIALVWWLTPLREWVHIPRLVEALRALGTSPLAPLALLAIYVIGGLLLVPVNVLIAVTVLVFGSVLGAIYALVGCVMSAATTYEVGRHFPAGEVRRTLERATDRLRARLKRHGLLAVIVVRIVPVAPYTVVNAAAGAMHVPRRQYLLGTALGMLPGIVFNALFIDRVLQALEHPNPTSYALLIAAGALIVAAIAAIRRRVARAHL
jgi:uncharacterized membrane protein YdjX (TVP38/TMEM64 family)